MNNEKIGQLILTKRKELKLTQKELAKKINVTDKAISKWERGVGCPDISLLEPLSNALNISVLDLLKGEIVKNENKDELDKYVLDTINYSKNQNSEKFKKIISNFLFSLIIIFSSYIMILNITHIFYLNEKIEFNQRASSIKNIKENIEKIENNINIIENNKGIFSDKDHKEIVNLLKQEHDNIKNNYIFKIKDYITLNDLALIDSNIKSLNQINIYKKLENYSDKINSKLFAKMKATLMFVGNKTMSEPIYSYEYKYNNFINHEHTVNSIITVNSRIIYYDFLTELLLDITNKTMEVGEINE